MFGAYTGYYAGLTTSLLWTGTTVFFTAASRRLGSWTVNAFRILLAIVLHAVTYRVVAHQWFPDASSQQLIYLALSGLVGLTIGDQALFSAFLRIGPRLTTLIAITAPLFAMAIGMLLSVQAGGLNERPTPLGALGIAMTLAGVAWVVLERPAASAPRTPQYASGVALALLAAACQGGGLVLSKIGMGHGLEGASPIPPQAATFVRMTFAGICVLPIYAAYRYRVRRRAEERPAPARAGVASGFALATCGALFGPYFGVWMSLVAADKVAKVGVAQTLCSLTPVFILPVAAVLYRERISIRAVLGAVIAFAGVALLMSRAAP